MLTVSLEKGRFNSTRLARRHPAARITDLPKVVLGGSGVDLLSKSANSFQALVDHSSDINFEPNSSHLPDNAKFFDLLAFDPRGISRSTPFHTCFTDPQTRLDWDLETAAMIPGESDHSFELMLAQQLAVYDSCFWNPSHNPNGSTISLFMGTLSIAEDTRTLVHKNGEWRRAQLDLSHSQTRQIPLEPSGSQRLNDKLRYVGLSYGTVIGATFAARYPQEVERMVLDAVVDSDDYWRGDWEHSVLDSDVMMAKFFEYCALATAEDCPFKIGNETADDLLRIFHGLQDRLRSRPLPVSQSTQSVRPDVITLSDLKNLVWWAGYSPLLRWRQMAHIIGDLAKDSGESMSQFKQTTKEVQQRLLGKCYVIDAQNPDCAPGNFNPKYAWSAVQCADGDVERTTEPTKRNFEAYLATLRKQSVFLGDAWSWLQFTCLCWRGRTNFRWHGPVQSNHVEPGILWTANTRDSVTLIANAYKMAEQFKNSAVLEIDAEGHSLLAAPSLCAAQHIRNYFQHGESPKHGTRCLPLRRALLGEDAPNVEKYLPGSLTKEELSLIEASNDLLNAMP